MGSARKSCTDRSTNSSQESTYTIAAVAGGERAAPVRDRSDLVDCGRKRPPRFAVLADFWVLGSACGGWLRLSPSPVSVKTGSSSSVIATGSPFNFFYETFTVQIEEQMSNEVADQCVARRRPLKPVLKDM
jgi:hypothetical protein